MTSLSMILAKFAMGGLFRLLIACALIGSAGCNLIGQTRKDSSSWMGKKAEVRKEQERAFIEQCNEAALQAESAVPFDPTMTQCLGSGQTTGLCQVNIDSLAPAQGAVGMEQVALKALRIRRMISAGSNPSKLDAYLRENPQPIVIGPGGTLYIIDHHHLARALQVSYVPRTYGWIVRDLSDLNQEDFWQRMDHCRWVYPFDHNGERLKSYEQLPKTIKELGDDPFRSLAGVVRRAGGFYKVNEPFVEFKWAERFRKNLGLSAQQVSDNFAKAEKRALKYAESPAAADLPGYSGVGLDKEQPQPTQGEALPDECQIPPIPSNEGGAQN